MYSPLLILDDSDWMISAAEAHNETGNQQICIIFLSTRNANTINSVGYIKSDQDIFFNLQQVKNMQMPIRSTYQIIGTNNNARLDNYYYILLTKVQQIIS